MANPAPKSLSSPSLRDVWSKAKKAAEKQASALDKKSGGKTQKTALVTLEKSFKADLGPNLEKWPKLYPDYPKMESLWSDKIEPAIKAYAKAIARSDVDPSIQAELNTALAKVASAMDKRDEEAKRAIASDESLAIAASKKKSNPPIVVLRFPDVTKSVKLAGQNVAAEGSLSIEVVIGADEVLSKFPPGKDYANKAAKIVDAADGKKLLAEIRKAFETADRNVGSGKSLSGEESKFLAAVDDAVVEAVKRATAEAGRLGGLSAKVTWARVKRGGRLTLALAGAAAGVAGLATTPFTAGVSTVAGVLGLAKASVAIGRQIADIASTAEMMANGIAKDLTSLQKQYARWAAESKRQGKTSDKVGAAELGKRAANALLPTAIATLKSVAGDADTYDEKIDSLEKHADDLGDDLGDWLQKQDKADTQYEKIRSLGRDALTDAETKTLQKILAALAKSESRVSKIIDAVTKLNARVKNNRKLHGRLTRELAQLRKSNPTWSEVGAVLFEASSSVAFMIAGNVNAPDPYKFAEAAAKIASAIGTTADALSGLDELANGLADSYEARKKKVRS